MADCLIIYYSRRGQNYAGGKICTLEKGNSERIAEYIRDYTGADMFQVETLEPYPEDYMECTETAKKEYRKNARPVLKEYLTDISGYDHIFICGPCWWGTYPMAVFSLLEKLDFKGKNVHPVMTHEGSGAGSCEKDLKKTCSGARISRCLAIQGTQAPDSGTYVARWAEKMLS